MSDRQGFLTLNYSHSVVGISPRPVVVRDFKDILVGETRVKHTNAPYLVLFSAKPTNP